VNGIVGGHRLIMVPIMLVIVVMIGAVIVVTVIVVAPECPGATTIASALDSDGINASSPKIAKRPAQSIVSHIIAIVIIARLSVRFLTIRNRSYTLK
jgi:hypothetical protein